MRGAGRARSAWGALFGTLLLGLGACSTPPPPDNTPKAAAVCGHVPAGPATAPAGAVTVDPAVHGDLLTKTEANPPGTTFWLAPGTHTLGDGEYDQVGPKEGDHYIGAPGAIVDGKKVNRYAFSGKATKVTIEHLTITGFKPPDNEGAVNHDSGAEWTILANDLVENAGAAVMGGTREVLKGNCLRNNGQYGLNGCCDDLGGLSGLVIEGNEFVGNNAEDVEKKYPEGCGCSGAMKLWAVNGADIRGNWIHDNRGPGIWADTNNNDFLIEDNVIENNDDTAIFYETSYNATIRNNLLKGNNLVAGRKYVQEDDSFPVAAIYISESGGEPRVKARTAKIEISGNTLVNNWSGITLWENADRFCNSPANSSTGVCTLLVPEVAKCAPPGIAAEPLRGDCRWKTQNVDIHDNHFSVDPAAIDCREMCARMGLLSNFGTVPDWSPYQAEAVEQAITYNQNNRWSNNRYSGPWTFVTEEASRLADPARWQGVPYQQDQGSTFDAGGGN
ncbi:right-handed parallel beta-helix repeat-containing protein [Amycolatopsis sp. NPDC051758]|uniref:right-handed parallel beta-helix repeat-containing protein n=1 Tax=Amycolatopsis sp. NPDC051758 TaxID=3363935 RepID=UPI0037B6CE6C